MIYLFLSYLFFPLIKLLSLLRGKDKPFKKILVIQAAKIGDFICSTHLFREIKKTYPNSRLTVMVNPIVKEIAELNPYIDEVIPISSKGYKGFLGKIRLANLIRKGRYDVGITLNPNLPFTIGMLWGLIPIRLTVMPNFCGLTFRLASKFFTKLEPHASGRLVVETYLKLLNHIDIKTDNIAKEVYQSIEADKRVSEFLGLINKPLIGIAVSSGNKLKEIASKKIAEIIDQILKEIDAYIVLIGSAQDKLKAQEVLSLVKVKERILDSTGRFNLGELPALIKKLSVFIGVDTGITYMADALKVPIVYIPGPIDTSEQRPVESRMISIFHRLSCMPCSFVFKTTSFCKYNSKDCINLVTSEEIVLAVKKLLEN
ncbi:glycosyltransferase family 9 protein [Thermodesulfobacterium sp. TA1]|uniref:glycosyltransferase family 9 protein n=1 Tax=Thermodesulfobacterium sp. TA1 TaxID=2234087 RepID=UPI0012325E68|nr:glycosyltransferase family 9 protein [Thermodesulfobacterium sp. TA1]QER42694.1 glycosyltransferase family 9 protein [Thermodesulfobacterium sp. TA1]